MKNVDLQPFIHEGNNMKINSSRQNFSINHNFLRGCHRKQEILVATSCRKQNSFRKYHSSEIRGLCFMKCSSQMLQNLPYFWSMKTHIVFFVFHFMLLYFFPLMNALVYVDLPGHLLGGKI